jgi:hypothetical protein
MTSNRLVRTDYFKQRVDGWLSLSGGRLGGNPGRGATFSPTASRSGAPAPSVPSSIAATMAALREPPDADISFIYTTGEREVDEKGVPETSDWATRHGCGSRREEAEIVDAKAGYVFDSSRLNLMRPGWGLLPAPGKAKVVVSPDGTDGRVVADVGRLEKGPTEGLEPKVTEKLVELMLQAKGGKLRQAPPAAQPSSGQ